MSEYAAQSGGDVNVYAKEKNAIIVDLRSDTVTKPSPAMKLAMSNAIVGDDVFGEDPTVNELEDKAAQMLGKEAAIFVTSGTMGNLIAIMVHCKDRGCEAYCGEYSHVVLHEQGGASQIAGVMICPIPNCEDGTFCLKTLESKIRRGGLHDPISRLVIVENTFNGQILDESWLRKVSEIASRHNLKLHMDGARLWNAVVGSGKSAAELVRNFDSVSFCLSKGLGAPVGSILCGSHEFVSHARRVRKVLGGGMRQVGVLAAAGIVALEESIPILKVDHSRAYKMATAIKNINSNILHRIDDCGQRTNMVFLNTKDDSIYDAKTFVERLSLVLDEPKEPRVIVRALALTDKKIRLVFHRDITDDMLDSAISKIQFVLDQSIVKTF